jgi:maltose alpha-D-glucosyltransferase/alpha-amylase
LTQILNQDIPSAAAEAIGPYGESARLLGVRTAELHMALASDPTSPAFAPEPYTPHHRRGVFESMRSQAVDSLRLLRKRLVPAEVQPLAQRVTELEPELIARFRALYEHRLSAKRLRLHGDFHLGQVLWTGSDFVFIDFEGASGISLGERRIKHCPLRDVVTMLRSFHHAAHCTHEQRVASGSQGLLPKVEPWLRYWNLWVSAAYLKAYFQTIGKSGILPENQEDLGVMLEAYLLSRLLEELSRELNGSGASLPTVLHGILFLVGEAATPFTPVSHVSKAGDWK